MGSRVCAFSLPFSSLNKKNVITPPTTIPDRDVSMKEIQIPKPIKFI